MREVGLEQRTAARVIQVLPGGAAARAGIESGDLLVGFDAHRVGGVDDLHRLLIGSRIGSSVPLDLIRRGRPLAISITPAEAEAD